MRPCTDHVVSQANILHLLITWNRRRDMTYWMTFWKLINVGLGDPDELAQWVVAQRLDYYEDIMMQPTKMPPELPSCATVPPWTGLVSRVYRQRYNAPVRFRDDPPPGQPFADHPSFR